MCSLDPCTVRNWRVQTPMLDRCEPNRGCFTVAATVALLLPYCCVLLCTVVCCVGFGAAPEGHLKD